MHRIKNSCGRVAEPCSRLVSTRPFTSCLGHVRPAVSVDPECVTTRFLAQSLTFNAAKRRPVPCRAEGTSSSAKPAVDKTPDLIKGCKTVLSELSGLDFSRSEARLYLKLSTKLPKGSPPDFDIARARTALDQLLDSSKEEYRGPTEALKDEAALQVLQNMLSEVWRWRRRGGGMEEESEAPPHQLALQDIQRMKLEDIDRITSSLLDNLPMTDKEKSEIGGAVERVAFASIGGAVWGSLVLTLLGIAVLQQALLSK
mmetsp:Transcript_37332/g.83065  ORF Transcript_37332/g.83065 Transcript_37332/m.83065 type:complete len:257 (+) Transcript_37332:13-783(+)